MKTPQLPTWVDLLPGEVGFKGGVARNFLLGRDDPWRDVDLIWWLPDRLLEEVDDMLLEGGGFTVVDSLLENLERLRSEGFDVEVWPLGYDLDYFFSRDLNVNMCWVSREGVLHKWEGLITVTDVWTCSDSPSIREVARCLLMSLRLGLPHCLESWQVQLLSKRKQTWVCFRKAQELGLAEEYCAALGCSWFLEANLDWDYWKR